MKYFFTGLIFLALFCFFGCNGGGGDDSSEPESVTVKVANPGWWEEEREVLFEDLPAYRFAGDYREDSFPGNHEFWVGLDPEFTGKKIWAYTHIRLDGGWVDDVLDKYEVVQVYAVRLDENGMVNFTGEYIYLDDPWPPGLTLPAIIARHTGADNFVYYPAPFDNEPELPGAAEPGNNGREVQYLLIEENYTI